MTKAKTTHQTSPGPRAVGPCLSILLLSTAALLLACGIQPSPNTPEIADGQVDLNLTQSSSHVTVQVRADMLFWVDFYLDDALSPFHTAIASPFSATLATGGLQAGAHRIRVVATVDLLDAMSTVTRHADFEVGTGEGTGEFTVHIANAQSGDFIRELESPDTLNVEALGGDFSLVAVPSEAVGSVLFGLDGNPSYRIENKAPYAINDDSNGLPHPLHLSDGSHHLTVVLYSEPNAGGDVVSFRDYEFSLLNTENPDPEPDQTSSSEILNNTQWYDDKGTEIRSNDGGHFNQIWRYILLGRE